MKIISWNIENIGATNLNKALGTTFSAAGLGATRLAYIMKVVMGDAAWENITSTDPVDVFVIIELKTGTKGRFPGAAPGGTCAATLTQIVAAMNTAVTKAGKTATYHYAYVPPLYVGRKMESVGIIYNDKVLTYQSSRILKDVKNNNILPRTPFLARFMTVGGAPKALNIVGVHAPPTKGTGSDQFKKPIQFCERMSTATQISQSTTAKEDLLVMGDFNCSPDDYYEKQVNSGGKRKRLKINAFADLENVGYATTLPDGTKTSLKDAVAPTNIYLSQAYDNVFYKLAGGGAPPVEKVLDTIGNARDVMKPSKPTLFPAKVKLLLSSYLLVSDHLPVQITYT